MKANVARKLAIALIWVLGLAAIWWLIPVGPRDGWQPAAGEVVCGYLQDATTIVTAARGRPTASNPLPTHRPIHLWNSKTGQLVASYFDADAVPVIVRLIPDHHLLALEDRRSPTGTLAHSFRLRLYEDYSGRELLTVKAEMAYNRFWWEISGDGSLIGYVTSDDDGPKVELRDIRTGRLFRTFPGWHGPICFSRDGKMAACKMDDVRSGTNWQMAVWDVSSGQELAFFTQTYNSIFPAGPICFSPDGTMLLDSRGRLWDLASNQKLLQVPQREFPTVVFTRDGSRLVQLRWDGSGNSLTYWNIRTREEEVARRNVVGQELAGNWMNLTWATPDAEILIAHGFDFVPASKWRHFLNKSVGFPLSPTSQNAEVARLIETATGREIRLGHMREVHCSPDGRTAVTLGPDGCYQLWDLPPRKPLRWFLPAAAAWTTFVALLAWWRVRRSRVAAAAASC
jgi:WD40 repeat protein